MRDLPRYPKDWCMVGQKLRIRPDLQVAQYDCYVGDKESTDRAIPQMLPMAGQIVTVDRFTSNNKIHIKEDGNRFFWTAAMFESSLNINLDAFDELFKV